MTQPITINTALIETTMLDRGSHHDRPGACALEVVNLALGLGKFDNVPECSPRGLACLPRINDSITNNKERTEFLRPYLLRLAVLQRDDAKDMQVAYRHADLAVRVFAPAALDRVGLADQSTILRGLRKITNKTSAEGAAWAAWAAAAWAAWAAWAAAAGAAWAAGADERTAQAQIIRDLLG